MDQRQHQSQQRVNASNTSHNQPANSRRHHGHQSQSHQTNSAGTYPGGPIGASNSYSQPNQQPGGPPVGASNSYGQPNQQPGGPPVGASNSYGQPDQQPVNTSHDHQQQGYTNNMQVVDPYARSPAGPEGGHGSGSIRQTLPNPREVYIDNRNSARMGQQVAPALQRGNSSRGSASGHEWDGSHQPSHIRSGNPGSLHNVQEQHHYARGALVQPPARDVPGPSGFSRSSNNKCRIPDCNQLGFFNAHIQEQLDYCEAHLATALRGYAAACKGCGSLPVLQNSDYCSRFCAGGGRSAAIVPQGFAPACQECRRAITENMQIYGGHFCSPECWNAYLTSTHSSRR